MAALYLGDKWKPSALFLYRHWILALTPYAGLRVIECAGNSLSEVTPESGLLPELRWHNGTSALARDLLYAGGLDGLSVWDVTLPTAPQLRARTNPCPGTFPVDVAVDGPLVAASSESGGLWLLNWR